MDSVDSFSLTTLGGHENMNQICKQRLFGDLLVNPLELHGAR